MIMRSLCGVPFLWRTTGKNGSRNHAARTQYSPTLEYTHIRVNAVDGKSIDDHRRLYEAKLKRERLRRSKLSSIGPQWQCQTNLFGYWRHAAALIISPSIRLISICCIRASLRWNFQHSMLDVCGHVRNRR